MISRTSESPYTILVHTRRCPFLKILHRHLPGNSLINIYVYDGKDTSSEVLPFCSAHPIGVFSDGGICRNWVVATPFTKPGALNFP
jgi:hypothetical protein